MQSGSSPTGSWWSVTTTSRPEALGELDLVASTDAAVDRDQEPGALGGERLDRLGRDPVAVAEAVGQPPDDVAAEQAQRLDDEEGGGDAVGVVVTVDGDALAPAQRPVDAGARLGHARQEKGVVHTEVGMQEGARRFGVGESAPDEDLGDDVADFELARQRAGASQVDGGDGPGVVCRSRRYCSASWRRMCRSHRRAPAYAASPSSTPESNPARRSQSNEARATNTATTAMATEKRIGSAAAASAARRCRATS